MRHEGIAQHRQPGIRRLQSAERLIGDEPHQGLDRIEVALSKVSYVTLKSSVAVLLTVGSLAHLNLRQAVGIASEAHFLAVHFGNPS